MDRKFLASFIILVSFNLLILITLWKLGFLIYYIMVGIGIALGLMLSEGVGSLKKVLLGSPSWIFLWVTGVMIYICEDFYKVKVWWFKKRYRINEDAVKEYAKDLIMDMCKECEPVVSVKVGFFDELDKVVLVVFMRDYDELVKKWDEIVRRISEKFGIPKDRIVIYWDDSWKYY